jgi:hypothetical protein
VGRRARRVDACKRCCHRDEEGLLRRRERLAQLPLDRRAEPGALADRSPAAQRLAQTRLRRLRRDRAGDQGRSCFVHSTAAASTSASAAGAAAEGAAGEPAEVCRSEGRPPSPAGGEARARTRPLPPRPGSPGPLDARAPRPRPGAAPASRHSPRRRGARRRRRQPRKEVIPETAGVGFEPTGALSGASVFPRLSRALAA